MRLPTPQPPRPEDRGDRRCGVILTPVLILLLSAPLPAAALRIFATVDRTQLTMDDQVQLTITVVEEGAAGPAPLTLPDLSGDWEVVGRTSDQRKGATKSGKLRVTSSYLFQLKPKRLGPATIGPATMRRGGQTHSTDTIELHVHVASPYDAGPDAGPLDLAPDFDPVLEGLESDAFLVVVPQPPDPYLGQQVTVTYRLYSRLAVVGGYPVDRPMFPDFHVKGLDVAASELEWHDVRIQGRKYIAKCMVRYAVFPTRAGALELDPFVVDLDVSQSWNSPDPPRRIRRASQPHALQVRPLPLHGRPEGFPSTNVGEYTLQARLSQSQVAAGEPVRFSITARGQGNVNLLAPPTIAEPRHLQILGPESRAAPGRRGLTVVGSRGWIYEVVSHRPGRYRVPSATLPYFDPHTGEYATATSEPLDLQVLAVPGSQQAGPAKPSPEEPRPVRTDHALQRCATPALVGPASLAVLILPPVLYLALLVARAVRRRREQQQQTAGYARQQAASESGKALKQAASADGSSPAAEVRRSLLLFLEGRLGLPARGTTRAELGIAARKAGLAGEQVHGLLDLLARCERAISRPGETSDAAGLVAEARALLAELERLAADREVEP